MDWGTRLISGLAFWTFFSASKLEVDLHANHLTYGKMWMHLSETQSNMMQKRRLVTPFCTIVQNEMDVDFSKPRTPIVSKFTTFATATGSALYVTPNTPSVEAKVQRSKVHCTSPQSSATWLAVYQRTFPFLVGTLLEQQMQVVAALQSFAIDQWCHCQIQEILWLHFNKTVGEFTTQVPLSDIIRQRRLTLLGHIACMHTHVDTCSLLTALVLAAWQHPSGMPWQSWLSNILSFGLWLWGENCGKS